MRVTVNSHALPIYKKNRIASFLCIFETTILLMNEKQVTLLTFGNSTLLHLYRRRVQKVQMQVIAIIKAMSKENPSVSCSSPPSLQPRRGLLCLFSGVALHVTRIADTRISKSETLSTGWARLFHSLLAHAHFWSFDSLRPINNLSVI